MHFFFFPVVGSLGDLGHFVVVLFVSLAHISPADADALWFDNNVGKPAIVPFAESKETRLKLALRASGVELGTAGNGSITMNGNIPDVSTRLLHFMMGISREMPNNSALACRPLRNCASDRQVMAFEKYTPQFGNCNT